MMFFATEYTPPTGMDEMLARIMYLAVFLAAISHFIKSWLPKPPMEQQVRDLEDRLTKKIDAEIDVLGDWVVEQHYATKGDLEAAQKLNQQAREFKTEEIKRLSGDLMNLMKRLGDVESSMSNLPHRIVALLRDTKGLIP